MTTPPISQHFYAAYDHYVAHLARLLDTTDGQYWLTLQRQGNGSAGISLDTACARRQSEIAFCQRQVARYRARIGDCQQSANRD